MFGIGEIKNEIQRLIRYDELKDKEILRLHNRITELESKEEEFKKELDKLNWKLENPCPYKVGEKLKNGEIITEVYVSWLNNCHFGNLFNKNAWSFKTVKPLK